MYLSLLILSLDLGLYLINLDVAVLLRCAIDETGNASALQAGLEALHALVVHSPGTLACFMGVFTGPLPSFDTVRVLAMVAC